MEVEFLGLSDYASLSREGKLNILGIFRQIYVRRLPTRYLKFFVVIILAGEAGVEVKLRVQIVSPLKQLVMPAQRARVQFGPSRRAHLMLGVVNLPLRVAGEYRVEVFSQRRKMAVALFEVVKVELAKSASEVN